MCLKRVFLFVVVVLTLLARAVAVVHKTRTFYFITYSPPKMPLAGIIFYIHLCFVWAMCFTYTCINF